MKKLFLAAAAASVMISSAATAAVTYNPATGGFAGKGDVQSAFGWNNADLQAEAGNIKFRWEAPGAVYEAICEFDTYGGKEKDKATHHVTKHSISTSVEGAVAGDPRAKREAVTGFNLGPVVASSSSVELPVVGTGCKGGEGNAPGEWTSVSLISGSAGGGVLYAIDTTNGREAVIYTQP